MLFPPLVDLLKAVARERTGTQFSIDPGYHWCSKRREALSPLLKLADYVFLNEREFWELADPGEPLSEKAAAKYVLQLARKGSAVVVRKKHDRVDIHRLSSSKRLQTRTIRQQVVRDELIVDDTGAGDAFAAGFLATELSSAIRQRAGASLGLELARYKLRQIGPVEREIVEALAGGTDERLQEERARRAVIDAIVRVATLLPDLLVGLSGTPTRDSTHQSASRQRSPRAEYFAVEDEAGLQRVLFPPLRAVIDDLKREHAGNRVGGGKKVVDFFSDRHQLGIEVKFPRSTRRLDQIINEVGSAILHHGLDERFRALVVLIYDPHRMGDAERIEIDLKRASNSRLTVVPIVVSGR